MTRLSLLTGSLLLVGWLVTMGFLVRNHYTNTSPLPDYTSETLFGSVTPVSRWEDIEEYMLIVQTDPTTGKRTTVGASATEIRLRDDPSSTATYTAKVILEGKISPLLPKATVKVSGVLDKKVNLTQFYGEASLGPASYMATGLVANNLLYLKSGNYSNHNLLKRELTNKISMAEAMRPALGNQMDIKTGNQMSAPVLDPLTGQSRGTLTIRIGEKEPLRINGRDLEAHRVISSLGDIDTLMWVDAEGNTLRRQLVGGLAMERTTREEALKVAPSIGDPIQIPTIDLSEFAGTGITHDGDGTKGGNLPGLGALQALLK